MAIDDQPMNVYWSGQRTETVNRSKINYKGSVAASSDLPNTNNQKGDMYSVTGLGGENYIWNGTAWDSFGTSDADVVHKTGDETIAGTKTFSSTIVGSVSGTATDLVNGSDTSDLASVRGLFGCIDSVFGEDLNSYTKSGLYYISGITGNKPKDSISNGYLLVIATASNDNRVKQLFSRHGTANSNDHETYIRTKSNSTWSLWHRVITQSGDGSFVFDGIAYPYSSNTCSLGTAEYLWKEIFCANATINTSDERLKQDISSIPDEVLDAWSDVDFRQLRFRDAVQVKGSSARLHNGLIAQRIAEIFEAHGLDASRYGLFCHDSWETRETEDGAVPAGDLYSLRYVEALCMEAAYQRRKANRLEARIEALEEKLK